MAHFTQPRAACPRLPLRISAAVGDVTSSASNTLLPRTERKTLSYVRVLEAVTSRRQAETRGSGRVERELTVLAAGARVSRQTLAAARHRVTKPVHARAVLVTVGAELAGRTLLLLIAPQTCGGGVNRQLQLTF